jgi:AmmeMemoRadiSam system protein A
VAKFSSVRQALAKESGGKTSLLALLRLARFRKTDTPQQNPPADSDSAASESVTNPSKSADPAPRLDSFDAADRQFMLGLARASLADAAANPDGPGLTLEAGGLAPKLVEQRACFVTLTSDGLLRGCIGHILPQKALYQAVIDSARNAALHDPRFPAVQPAEVDNIRIEISVLTEPQPLAFNSPEDLLEKLQPHRDGVVLRIGPFSATFLPQVWEKVSDKIEFLNCLSEKAGCRPSAWRGEETSVSIYQVECFEEPDVKPGSSTPSDAPCRTPF